MTIATLKSWQTVNLTENEQKIRDKNLWTTTWALTQDNLLPTNQETPIQQATTPVQVQSWQTINLTPTEQKIRDKNLWTTPPISNIMPQPETQANPPINQPEKTQVQPPKVEKTTVSTPKWTSTTTKETPIETKPITAETDWKTTDKSLWTLEQMVEARYGTVATQNPDWTLSAIIGDKKYQWEITPEWPRKTEVQLTPAEQIKMKAINKYMTASADELYSAMINWNITKEMEQSIMSNPNYAIAKEKVSKKLSTDNINSQMNGIYNSMTWKTTEEDSTLDNMSNKLTSNLTSKWIDVPKFSEYIAKDETLSADVISLNSQIKQIKELKDTAEANTKRIIEQYPWISKSGAILLSARQNEPLYEQIKALSYDATELQANINYRQSILEEDYKAELSQYQLEEERAYQQQLIESERAYNKELTAEERAYNEQQAITNLENQYKYTYWDLDSTNPTLQNIAIKNALTDMYTKYQDIPWLESMAIKEWKVQDLIAQWMTWSQAIAQVENEIRNSWRYKDLITPKTKYWYQSVWWNLYRTDDSWNISLAIEWPNKFTKLDDWTYQDEQWNIITADEIKQQKLLSNPYLNAEVWTNVWIECGQYARSAVWMTSTPWWKSLKDRKTAFSEAKPQLWWLVLFNWKWYDKTYWHIAVVTWINADWTINIKESNLNRDNKVTERFNINPTSKSWIWWYYNNTPLAWWWNGTNWSSWLDDMQYKRVNSIIDDLSQDQVTKTFKKSQEAYNFATKVKVWNNSTDNQALIYAFAKAMDPDSVVREWEYSTVQKYAQTWWNKFWMDINRVLNWEEFISEKAKTNIVNTIKTKYEASKDSYNYLRNNKIKMINDITWKDIWEKALPSDVMDFKETKTTWWIKATWKSWKVYILKPKNS